MLKYKFPQDIDLQPEQTVCEIQHNEQRTVVKTKESDIIAIYVTIQSTRFGSNQREEKKSKRKHRKLYGRVSRVAMQIVA